MRPAGASRTRRPMNFRMIASFLALCGLVIAVILVSLAGVIWGKKLWTQRAELIPEFTPDYQTILIIQRTADQPESAVFLRLSESQTVERAMFVSDLDSLQGVLPADTSHPIQFWLTQLTGIFPDTTFSLTTAQPVTSVEQLKQMALAQSVEFQQGDGDPMAAHVQDRVVSWLQQSTLENKNVAISLIPSLDQISPLTQLLKQDLPFRTSQLRPFQELQVAAESPLTLAVLNTTELSGLASHITQLLQARGYRVVQVTNDTAAVWPSTAVLVEADAQLPSYLEKDLRTLFPRPFTPVVDAEKTQEYRANVVIILGEDWLEVFETSKQLKN